jgi:diguanylate cyclase (GGDEF)-like protein/PAS domain S-box-containing protein
VRWGNLARLQAAVERELSVPAPKPAAARTEADSVDRYQALIEEIPELLIYTAWADETGSRAYVSPQLVAMTGFTPGEWLAEPDMWVRRLHPEDRERVLRQFREACATGGRFASEYRILDHDGRVRWWRDEGLAQAGPDGKTRFVRGFAREVTEQKLAEESLIRHRDYDQPTGLKTRELLKRQLGPALAESSRSGQPLALVFLALYRFPEIVSTLGYHNKDLIVRSVAGRLGDALGDRDRVARLRGDEFGVLLPGADTALARQVGDRMLGALAAPFMVQRLPIEISASVGIAVAPEHGTEAETLLRHADAAVQAARRLGGGVTVEYSPQCEPYDPARLALLGELRRALEANELTLHYQPKVDLKTHTVVGAEALLRWPHPKRGYVPPADYIEDAEHTGLMRPLTRWVLERAANEARAWERGWTVAVNVSARSLHDGHIVDDVAEVLSSQELPGERLEIEVTESAVMLDPGRAADTLGNLRRRGVSISIDDFGKGATSLALLPRLPVSELKIDKQFVIGMASDGADDSIVRSANDLAHNLNLTVVAEGVEDQWTLDQLTNLGCDQAQGYHIARPMPASELIRWLNGSTWRKRES